MISSLPITHHFPLKIPQRNGGEKKKEWLNECE